MKLNYKRTILIGLAFMSICAFWQFYDNEIPRILTYHFGLGETWTGAIMALDNILALFLLPIFGLLSDKTNTKIGKRMPFILIGTAVSVTLFAILIYIAKISTNLLLFIAVLFMLLVSMGTYRSPAVALMPELTPAKHRSKANAIINLMGTLGAVYTLIMIKVLLKSAANEADTNYIPLMLSIVCFMIITILILFITVPEKKLMPIVREGVDDFDGEGGLIGNDDNSKTSNPGTSKSTQQDNGYTKNVLKSLSFLLLSVFLWFAAYNAVTTAFSRYVTEVWDLHNGAYADCLMVATVAAVLAYLPIGMISSKIGRKLTILIGISLMSLCYIAAALMNSYSPVMNIYFAIIGIGWAAINVNSYPMVVEMGRSEVIGKYTGLYYTFSMAAQVFTPIFSGFLLEHVSYRTLFPYAFFFSCAAFITMLLVKHGDVKPQKKKSILENFDVDD
ncbi:MFS transporter [Butyrivibrio sp. AE3004]|uniref:MFS transporter n=1 Tax=Butyrivibrio sp. AE3004 TaxID=1506994 RepID=UPI0004948880|nr:MFS transporter [Butyrivibrio sp. AE3004]